MSRAGTTRQSEPEFHRVGSIVLLGKRALDTGNNRRSLLLIFIRADFSSLPQGLQLG